MNRKIEIRISGCFQMSASSEVLIHCMYSFTCALQICACVCVCVCARTLSCSVVSDSL